MPKHKSAKKRVKTNLKRQTRNRAAKSTLKSTLKALKAMPPGSEGRADSRDPVGARQGGERGIVHRNKAARLKSRATRKPKS